MKLLKEFLYNLWIVTIFIGGAAAIISAGVGFISVGIKIGGNLGGAAGLVVFLILFVSTILTIVTKD